MNLHLLVMLTLATGPTGESGRFRYRHLETTGLTDELQLGGDTTTAIRFASESSAPDLKSFRALLGCGIDGVKQRVFLTGTLKTKVLHTPSAPDRAASEPYREFVLSAWAVEAPPEGLEKACPKAFHP